MPIRIQRKRTKNWRMPENTIYVGRPSKWGNPFGSVFDFISMHITVANAPADIIIVQGDDGKIHECATARIIKKELHGKNLACWCSLDKVCHADYLLKMANEL